MVFHCFYWFPWFFKVVSCFFMDYGWFPWFCWLRSPQNCILAQRSSLGLAGRWPSLNKILSSECQPPNINFKISTKHQHLDQTQTSKFWPNLALESRRRFNFIISTKHQQQNNDKDSQWSDFGPIETRSSETNIAPDINNHLRSIDLYRSMII